MCSRTSSDVIDSRTHHPQRPKWCILHYHLQQKQGATTERFKDVWHFSQCSLVVKGMHALQALKTRACEVERCTHASNPALLVPKPEQHVRESQHCSWLTASYHFAQATTSNLASPKGLSQHIDSQSLVQPIYVDEFSNIKLKLWPPWWDSDSISTI